ncbi:twin-arginine translocase subunit TatC [Clostridium chromiireducens]|uniref:twin-arginine translocase subunit TatC n=1 Tax=Clostridium chromiireducens TaxID=225345 RepID=UPI001FA98460|nr:twin-arginine translocase subunit TatC [Clostridium chromiireducens]
MNEKEIAVTEHLEELRKRIIIALVSITVASAIAYSKIILLIEFMMKPLKGFNLELVFFSLTEGFITRFKLAVLVGIVCMSPIIFYEIIAFIIPGLKKKEKVLLYCSIFFLCLFFVSGILFGYIILLPYVLNFLMNYSQSYLNPILSGSMYLGFIGAFCLVIGFIFIIPLLLLILGLVGIINSKILRKSRRYMVLGLAAIELSFIPAADMLTFFVVILPVVVVYEIAIWIIYFIEKRKMKKLDLE